MTFKEVDNRLKVKVLWCAVTLWFGRLISLAILRRTTDQLIDFTT